MATFQKAERSKVRIRLGLIGPSGSGKSFSALRIAKGMAAEMGEGTKIALIDTEGRRSEYYADEFDFEVMHLDPPFHPERYTDAIGDAETEGFGIVIIDSSSHEWGGTGGILDIKDHMGGNQFTAWKELTPRHNRFLEKIVHSKCHVIATIRGKDAYVLEEEDKGGKKRQVPKKVGLGGEQRSGFEYEFTATFLLDQGNHVATPSKDNTHIFDGTNGAVLYEVLTEKHGRALIRWASKGKEAPPPPPEATNSTDQNGQNGGGNGKKHYTIADLQESAKKGIEVLAEAGAIESQKELDRMHEFLEEIKEDRHELVVMIKGMKQRLDKYKAGEVDPPDAGIYGDSEREQAEGKHLEEEQAEKATGFEQDAGRAAKEAELQKAGLTKGVKGTTTKAKPRPTQEEEGAAIQEAELEAAHKAADNFQPTLGEDPIAEDPTADQGPEDVAARQATGLDPMDVGPPPEATPDPVAAELFDTAEAERLNRHYDDEAPRLSGHVTGREIF